MKIKDMSKEELELLSYTDLTNLILKEKNKSMNTPTIFKEICDLLNYSEEEYSNLIGDYYTSLTLDKRFVLLDNHEWDLREKHAIRIDSDDDEEEEETFEEEDEEEENMDDNLDEGTEEELDDNSDDDLEDLTVIDEEEDI
ncbi:MAG: DNA-directed RNA polymerase subunit delta [Bacilli bacterium]|nr:DNA-directed RNA polymerase subunit delta [Bacilli bacterium]